MPRASRKKSTSKKSKQSDDRTGLPMSAKASRGMDALRVVANVNALEEGVRLRAELAEAKTALEAVRRVAENYSRKYDELVFYARHPEHHHDELCTEIAEAYPDECENLRGAGLDFHLGVNTALLAMARLNMALSVYSPQCSPFVTPYAEPGGDPYDWDEPYNEGGYYDSDADTQVDAIPSWPKKFKDRRTRALEEFRSAHVPTYCADGLGYPSDAYGDDSD